MINNENIRNTNSKRKEKMISKTELKKMKKTEIVEMIKENDPYYFLLDLKNRTKQDLIELCYIFDLTDYETINLWDNVAVVA